MLNYQEWFYKKERTQSSLNKISQMNDYFIEFEKESILAYNIIKMRNEQNNEGKIIVRIDSMREADFTFAANSIVETMRFSFLVLKHVNYVIISKNYVTLSG